MMHKFLETINKIEKNKLPPFIYFCGTVTSNNNVLCQPFNVPLLGSRLSIEV